MAESSKKFLGQKLERIEHALTPSTSATGAATIADNIDILSTIVAAGFYTMTTGEAITGKIDANSLASKLKSKTGGKEYSAVTMHKNVATLLESFERYTASVEMQYDQTYSMISDINDLLQKMFGETNLDFFSTIYKLLGETIFTFEEFTSFYNTTFKKDLNPLLSGVLKKYFKPIQDQDNTSKTKVSFKKLFDDDQFEELRDTFEDAFAVNLNDIISSLLENPKLQEFMNKLNEGASATINIAGMSDQTVADMVASINSLYTGEVGSMQNFINGVKEFGQLAEEIEKINLGENRDKLQSIIGLINDENGLKAINFDQINFGTIPDLNPIFGDNNSFVAALIQGEENMSLIPDDLLSKLNVIEDSINKLTEIDFNKLNIQLPDLTNINSLFEPEHGVIPELFKNVSSIEILDPKKLEELEKGIDTLKATVVDIMDALSSENLEKINDANIKKGINIIKRFIDEISIQNEKAVKLDLSGLSGLFDTIIKVAEMGWWKRIQMKRGVQVVTDIINTDVANIMNNLKENLDESEMKVIAAKLGYFNTVIDLIFKTTDVGIGTYIKAKIGTLIIKDFIRSNIPSIIKAVNETASDVKNIKPALDSIKNVLSTITELGSVESTKLYDSSANITFIKDNLLESISQLIEKINSMDAGAIESARKLLGGDTGKEGLGGVIYNLHNLFNDYGIGTVFADMFKIAFMQSEVVLLNSLIKRLNKTEQLDGNVESKYKTLAQVIKTINDGNYGDPNKLEKIVNDELPVLNDVLNQLSKISSKINKFKSVQNDNLKTLFSTINEVNENLKQIKTDNKKLESLGVFLTGMSNISKTINKGKFDTSSIKRFESFTNELLSVLQGKNSPLNKIMGVTIGKGFNHKIKEISGVIKSLRTIGVAMGTVGILLPMIFLGQFAIKIIASGLRSLVSAISTINMAQIQISKHNLKNIMLLMLGASTVLLIGGYFISRQMRMIIGSFVFGQILSLFLKSLLRTLIVDGQKSMVALTGIVPLTMLIVAAGALLLVGGMILADNWPTIFGTLVFGALLDFFLWGLIHIFKDAGKQVAFSIGQIVAITGLVVLAGALLLVGGLIMADNTKVILGTFAFALELGLFLFGIISIIKWAGKETIMAAGQIMAITGLIVLSGALLLVGGLIMADNPATIAGTMLFAVTLGLFLAGIMAIFKFIKIGDIALDIQKAGAMAILVVSAGAVLLMGAYAQTQLNSLGGWLALSLFAVATIGFIGMMLGGFKLMEKLGLMNQRNLTLNIGNLLKLSLVVTLSGAMLLGAAYVIGNHPELFATSMMFCGLLLSFSLAMWGVSKVLQQMQGNVKKSLLTLGGIMLCIGLYTAMISYLHNTLQDIGKGNALIGALISLGEVAYVTAILAGLAGLMWLMGSYGTIAAVGAAVISAVALGVWFGCIMLCKVHKLMPDMLTVGDVGNLLLILGTLSLGLVALSIPMMLTILALPGIAIVASCVTMITSSIVKLNKAMDGIKPDKFKETATQVINAFGDIADAINDRFGGFKGLMYGISLSLATRPIEKVAHVLASIAESVEEYANLKVAIYSGTKKVGYRHLNKQDFKNAGENVSLIITTLGDAVINTYNKNPQMFQGGGWFTNSPFDIVTKSCGNLGTMLSKIAKAVKDYADLTITEYDSAGKEKGKRHLIETDFKNAANNVSLIITTLGDAVIDTYNKNPQMFDSGWFSDSIFDKVVSSCTNVGDMLSTIAKAVRDYANMTVTEYDSSGKEKGKRHLTESDFMNAGKNIQKLLIGDENSEWKGLYGTIRYIGDNYGDLIFAESGGFLGMGGSNILDKVVDSASAVGEMLSTISGAIKDYSELRIPIKYDDKGNPVDYRQMNDSDFVTAGLSIEKLLTGNGVDNYSGLLGTIQDIYANNSDLFEDEEAIEQIMGGMKSASEFIGNVLDIIKNYSDMKVPALDKNGNIISGKYKPIDNAAMIEAAKNIHLVLLGDGNEWKGLCTTVVTIMEDAAKNNPENKKGFWERVFSGNANESNMEYVKSLIAATDFIGKIMDIIKNFSTMQIPAVDKDGNIIKDKYTTLKPEDYKKVGENIRKLLIGDDTWKGITGEVIDAVKKVSENGTDISESVSKYMNMCNPILDFVEKMADTVKKFAESKYKDAYGKEVTINGEAGLLAAKNITTMMFGNEDPSKGLLSTIINKINAIKNDIDPETVSEYVGAFNEVLTLIEPMAGALKAFGEMKIEARDADGKVTSTTDLSNVDLSTLNTKMGNIVDATVGIASKTGDSSVLSAMQSVTKNASTLSQGITAFGTFAQTLWGEYAKMQNALNNNGIDINNVDVTPINAIKTLLIGNGNKESDGLFSLRYTEGIAGVINVLKDITDGGLFESNLDSISKDLITLSLSLTSLIKLADVNSGLIKSKSNNPFERLTNGLSSVNTSIAEIKQESIKNFKNENEEIDKFVRRINNIDMNKINAIRTLSESLIRLTNKFGTLEGLVHALSTDMNSTLLKLVKALTEAKETINKTDKIQDERHKKIDESIKLVKELMEKEMIVKITQEVDPNNPSSDSSLSNGGN